MALRIPYTNIFLGKNAEKRSLQELSIKDPLAFKELISGMFTISGVSVSEDSAIGLSAIWNCVALKARTLAQLPIDLYGNGTGGNKYVDFTNPVYALVKYAPNNAQTAFNYSQITQAHLELWGNSYSIIYRDRNAVAGELWPVHPSKAVPVLSQSRKLYYEISGERTFTSDEILHLPGLGFDGIKGKSPIRIAAENIGLGLAAQTYGSTFFSNGANVGSIYTHPNQLSDTAYNRLKDSLEKKNAGLMNANRPMILEEGMKFEKVGLPPEDAQFLETRKFQKSDYASMFQVPQHLIGVMDAATYSNIEHQAIEFVVFCMTPVLKLREEEMNRKLLRTDELGRKYFKYNVNGLLRGDSAARAQYYKDGLQGGWLSVNDIRKLEDQNPVEGGDTYLTPVNMISLANREDYDQSVIEGKQTQPGANTDPKNTKQ